MGLAGSCPNATLDGAVLPATLCLAVLGALDQPPAEAPLHLTATDATLRLGAEAFGLQLASLAPTRPAVGSAAAQVLRPPTRALSDDTEWLVRQILSIDQQLRAPAPTWVAPVVGGGIIVSATTFGLTALGVSLGASGLVVLAMVMGTLLGVVGLVVAGVAGFYGWAEATRRAQLEERRARLIEQLERKSPQPERG